MMKTFQIISLLNRSIKDGEVHIFRITPYKNGSTHVSEIDIEDQQRIANLFQVGSRANNADANDFAKIVLSLIRYGMEAAQLEASLLNEENQEIKNV